MYLFFALFGSPDWHEKPCCELTDDYLPFVIQNEPQRTRLTGYWLFKDVLTLPQPILLILTFVETQRMSPGAGMWPDSVNGSWHCAN